MRFDKQTIVWTIAIIALTACSLVVISGPQFKRIKELTAMLKSEQAEQVLSQNSEQEIAQLRKEVEALSAQTADYDIRVPAEDMLGSFLEELAGHAQQRELKTDEIEPSTPIKSSEVIALPIAFKLRGSFLNVFALLQDIERMPRLTRIERFETRIDEEMPGSVIAELELSLIHRRRQAG